MNVSIPDFPCIHPVDICLSTHRRKKLNVTLFAFLQPVFHSVSLQPKQAYELVIISDCVLSTVTVYIMYLYLYTVGTKLVRFVYFESHNNRVVAIDMDFVSNWFFSFCLLNSKVWFVVHNNNKLGLL